MRDLLKRWSELEGDRCLEGDRLDAADPILFEISSPPEFQRWVDPLDLSFRTFVTIDRAVRSAITAHKLIYRLETDSDGKCYVSILDPTSGASWKAVDRESAIALLTAHLAFLESRKTVTEVA